MNEWTLLVMSALETNLRFRKWVAMAGSGYELRANVDGRIEDNAVIAEFTTGVNGALANICADALVLVFNQVDWDAVLAAAKRAEGQLQLA